MLKILSIWIASILLLAACSKDKKEIFTNEGLNGNWRLVQVHDSYVNGGRFSWYDVPAESSERLTFRADSTYERLAGVTSNSQLCTGTYSLSGSRMRVTTGCGTVPEIMTISELLPSTLIIDRQGFEGTVRYKYIAEK